MRQSTLDEFKPKKPQEDPKTPDIVEVGDAPRLARLESKVDTVDAKVDQIIAAIGLLKAGITVEEEVIMVRRKKKKIALMRSDQQKTVQMMDEDKFAFGNELKAALKQINTDNPPRNRKK